MGIFGYLKGMIALAILAFIGYMSIWAFNFTGAVSYTHLTLPTT